MRRGCETEDVMGLSPGLFVCLFLASLGVFFMGVACIWWVSLQARELKRREDATGDRAP